MLTSCSVSTTRGGFAQASSPYLLFLPSDTAFGVYRHPHRTPVPLSGELNDASDAVLARYISSSRR